MYIKEELMLRADYAKAMQSLTDRMRAGTPAQAGRLVGFAWLCVHHTPLVGGRTPVARLRSHSHFLDALLLVGCWLKGEPVEQQLRAMHDEVFEAALGMGRFEPDMTGLRAACWSVFELYQAVLAAEIGETSVVARKVAWSAFLACQSADEGVTPAALEYQEKLFRETFDFPVTGDGLYACPCPV
jgi:hypothetical protein